MGLEGGGDGQLGMVVMEGDVFLVVDDDCSAGLHGWVQRDSARRRLREFIPQSLVNNFLRES